jgi:hypothetical protein
MQGGQELLKFKPLNHKGHVVDEEGNEIHGCHRGHTQHLNVSNPQPGRVYYHGAVRRNRQAHYRLEGWRAVGPEDPERLSVAQDPHNIGTPLDSHVISNDVILMWTPEEKYAERQIRNAKISEARSADISEEFIEKGRPLQERYGRQLYFRRADHGREIY